MENFKIGDVVELKSGGPDMTVTLVVDGNNPILAMDKTDRVHTAWFDGNKKQEGIFPVEAIKRVQKGSL